MLERKELLPQKKYKTTKKEKKKERKMSILTGTLEVALMTSFPTPYRRHQSDS